MFQKIQQLIDDKDALVFVLIDEVNDLHIFYCLILLFFKSSLVVFCCCFHPVPIWLGRWRVWQQPGTPASQAQSHLTPSESSTPSSPSWTKLKGRQAKVLICLTIQSLFWFYTYIFFSGHNLILQTFQRRHSNDVKHDRKDWLGICGPSWHQAVHRTPLCERRVQHLPLLPGGADEGHQIIFAFFSHRGVVVVFLRITKIL